MAIRPVFTVSLNNKFCIKEDTEFEFFSGFSDKQKKKCVDSLHKSYLKKNPDKRVLEISSKSEDELGVKLSAFNLMIRTKSGKEFSVESAFQSSKVFENGGHYTDLLKVPSIVAKKDERLRNSGKVIAFSIGGRTFPNEPKTYFYNWLYINTLHKLNYELAEQVVNYDAFTDIVFNPQKSINCQAEAVAIYVSLVKQGLIDEALKDENTFLSVVYQNTGKGISNPSTQCYIEGNKKEPLQMSLF